MTIYIEDLKFQCIIGILDFERITPQDVIIDIKIDYDYQKEFINYAEVSSLIENAMKIKKFELIEDALVDLTKELKEKFHLIQTLHLKISKPSILPNCTVSVGSFNKF